MNDEKRSEQQIRKELDKEMAISSDETCEHVYYDGAGHYCKLMPMSNVEDYPHKHWRVFCHGNKGSLYCKNAKCAQDKQTKHLSKNTIGDK